MKHYTVFFVVLASLLLVGCGQSAHELEEVYEQGYEKGYDVGYKEGYKHRAEAKRD